MRTLPAWILFGLMSTALGAESYQLPVELELPEGLIKLDLWNADVQVVFEPEGVATLRCRRQSRGKTPDPTLIVVDQAGDLVVRREETGDGVSPRIQVELVLTASSQVQVVGQDLDVAVTGAGALAGTDPEGEKIRQEKTKGGRAAVRTTIDVSGSNVELLNVIGAEIESTDSYVITEGTREQLTVKMDRGTAEIVGHRGSVVVDGRDGELDVSDSIGAIEAVLVGGKLVVRGGNGRFRGRAEAGAIELDGWQGRVVLQGRDSTFEVLAARGALELDGQSLETLIQEWQGVATIKLQGGRLEAVDIESQAKVEARDHAELVFQDVDGNVTLDQQLGSTFLTNVAGVLQADVTDGYLEVTGARQLRLMGRRAEITASEVARLTQLEVEDSRLDLDLTTILHNPVLTLHGASDGRVTLKPPCYIKLAEAQLLTGQIEVTGCVLHGAAQRRNRYDRQGLAGNRRVILNATLSEESRLEVEGTP